MAKLMLCANCLTQGKPRSVTRGSLAIEIALWLCIILPGVIYSLWRLTTRYSACPSCGAANMLPLASPRAQELLRSGAGQAAGMRGRP